MRILALDTASSTASVAIADDAGIIGESGLNTGLTHSECFLPMVDALLKHTRLSLINMDAIAVTAGPGSFTGLRIGIATAKAFAQSMDLPLVRVGTLEAQSRAAYAQGFSCPILDARRNEVYTALFKGSERLWPDQAISPEDLANKLLGLDSAITFCGNGVSAYSEILRNILGDYYQEAPEERSLFMASAAAIIGRSRYLDGDTMSAKDFLPYYLRSSEAEIRRKNCGTRK